MTTSQQLVDATRRYLLSGQSEELNRLDANMSSSVGSLTSEFPAGGIRAGVTISVGLEEMHVWSVSGRTASVQRSMNGSTPATHSDGDLITVQPKFSDFRVFQALNDDLLDLSSPMNGLFRIRTVDLTFQASQYGYDMDGVTASDVLSIYEVRYKTPGPEDSWPKIRSYELARNMDTAEFASGLALILHEAAHPGRAIRVRYKAPFGQVSALGDDVEVVAGLAATAMDLPPLGAAIRLMSGRDVKRSFTENQGEPRRADEVPVGAGVISMRGLIALRLQRIQAEAARLQSQYPAQR